MYQIKVFSGANPYRVEDEANEWLVKRGETKCIRLVQVTPTDVVYVSTGSGIQRYTLMIAYEAQQ